MIRRSFTLRAKLDRVCAFGSSLAMIGTITFGRRALRKRRRNATIRRRIFRAIRKVRAFNRVCEVGRLEFEATINAQRLMANAEKECEKARLKEAKETAIRILSRK